MPKKVTIRKKAQVVGKLTEIFKNIPDYGSKKLTAESLLEIKKQIDEVLKEVFSPENHEDAWDEQSVRELKNMLRQVGINFDLKEKNLNKALYTLAEDKFPPRVRTIQNISGPLSHENQKSVKDEVKTDQTDLTGIDNSTDLFSTQTTVDYKEIAGELNSVVLLIKQAKNEDVLEGIKGLANESLQRLKEISEENFLEAFNEMKPILKKHFQINDTYSNAAELAQHLDKQLESLISQKRQSIQLAPIDSYKEKQRNIRNKTIEIGVVSSSLEESENYNPQVFLFSKYKGEIFVPVENSQMLRIVENKKNIYGTDKLSELVITEGTDCDLLSTDERANFSNFGIKQTSRSGQTFYVSSKGSSLRLKDALPIEGETEAQTRTRKMATMIDMVKFQVTQGLELHFKGDPYMQAAGILFAEQLQSKGLKITVIQPPFNSFAPEVQEAARVLINQLKMDEIVNAPFFKKAQEYRDQLAPTIQTSKSSTLN